MMFYSMLVNNVHKDAGDSTPSSLLLARVYVPCGSELSKILFNLFYHFYLFILFVLSLLFVSSLLFIYHFYNIQFIHAQHKLIIYYTAFLTYVDFLKFKQDNK